MKTVTIQRDLYSFDELSSKAQERALMSHYQAVMSDFETTVLWSFTDKESGWYPVLKACGFTPKEYRVPLYGGGNRWDVDYHYNFGYGSEYVSFDGTWTPGDYDAAAVAALKDDRPTDTRLHEILDTVTRLYPLANVGDVYTVQGETDRRGWGAELEEVGQDDDGEPLSCNDLSDQLRALCEELDTWMTGLVRAEMDYQTGPEALKERAECDDPDGCVFTQDGKYSA